MGRNTGYLVKKKREERGLEEHKKERKYAITNQTIDQVKHKKKNRNDQKKIRRKS